jgi:hypothetical protein
MRRKIAGIVFLTLIIYISFSCKKETAAQDQISIKISLTSLSLNIGDVFPLNAKVTLLQL